MATSDRSIWKRWRLNSLLNPSLMRRRTLEQAFHVLNRNADIADGRHTAKNATFDKTTNCNWMNVQNIGRFGQGVNTWRKFHIE
jgi:hypothetical protein